MDPVRYHIGMLEQTAKPGPRRRRRAASELIDGLLGSAHVFSVALSGLMEERLLRDVAGAELTPAQLKVLRLVSQFEAQTVSDIAAFLGVSNAAASKAVDRVVRRKFLRRSEGEADRRANQLALTESGRKVLQEYDRQRKQRLEKIFSQFPAAQLREASDLLDSLAGAIVTHSARPEEVCLQCSVYLRQRCLLQEVVSRSCSYNQRQRRKAGQCVEPGRCAQQNQIPGDR